MTDFREVLGEVVASLREKMVVETERWKDHEPIKQYFAGYVQACDSILEVFDFACKTRGLVKTPEDEIDRTLPDGVQRINLNDPAELHNTLRSIFGE